MKQILPHPILTLMLLGLWLLLVNAVDPGHLLLGLLLAWLIPLFTARFWEARVRIRRPWMLLRFFGRVLRDILIANIAVARLVVGPGHRVRPGFIAMPLRLRGNVGVSLLANTISLTPGTLSAFLSADRRVLIIHGLQVDDPEAIIATIRERYETPLMHAMESLEVPMP
jgi:multicomponent K+:H+ antiporter subunit E